MINIKYPIYLKGNQEDIEAHTIIYYLKLKNKNAIYISYYRMFRGTWT